MCLSLLPAPPPRFCKKKLVAALSHLLTPHLFPAWGGAVAGRAVLGGVCVVTATSVTATRDHWVCIIKRRRRSQKERFFAASPLFP